MCVRVCVVCVYMYVNAYVRKCVLALVVINSTYILLVLVILMYPWDYINVD